MTGIFKHLRRNLVAVNGQCYVASRMYIVTGYGTANGRRARPGFHTINNIVTGYIIELNCGADISINNQWFRHSNNLAAMIIMGRDCRCNIRMINEILRINANLITVLARQVRTFSNIAGIAVFSDM